MRTIKKITALLLITAAVMALIPAMLTASAEEDGPALVITEVCFNPTFRENDAGLADTEDVLEYVEIYNRSDADVSVADCVMRLAKGYAADSRSQNAIVTVSDNPRVIKAGETAIFVCYQATSATLGYGYATDAEIRAYYDFFCEFYDCADSVSLHGFYIIPRTESGTEQKISGGFNLANSTEEVVLSLCRGESVLAECYYNAKLWNKNNRSVNMMWHEGMDTDRPITSKAVTTAGCTPGYVYANQTPNASLTPSADSDLLPVKAMAYNLQAEAKDQTAADGTEISDAMRTQKIFDTVAAHDPDVLVLCEINYRWLELLDGSLIGEGGKYAAYGRSGAGKYHDGSQLNNVWDLTSLVLWKTEKYDLIEQGTFWCSKMPNRPGSAAWDGGLTGDIPRAINWVILEDKSSGAQFMLAGAHLDAKSADIRALSTSLIAEKTVELARGLPIVIMGDFNCSDNSAAYRNIHDTALSDARYLVPTYGNMTVLGTFNKFGQNTDMQVRLPIDLCFVTPETVWVDSARSDYAFVDGGNSVYASDHNAVIFELKLQKLHTVDPEADTTDTTGTTAADTPTEPVTTPETEPADPPAATDTPTESPTAIPTPPATDAPEATSPPKGGCGASLAAVTLLTVIPVTLCLLRKKREK